MGRSVGTDRQRVESPRTLATAMAQLQQERDQRKQFEQALRESEKRYRSIFEHCNDAIFIIDPPQDRIVQTNAKAAEMLGYTRGELTRMPLSAVHPDEMDRMLRFVERVTLAGHGFTDEVSCRTKDGRILPTEISASLLPLEGRSLIVAFVRDVTQRQRAENALQISESNFRGLLESLPDGVLIATGEGRIQLANAQIETMFGYQREELRDQPVEVLIPEHLRPVHGRHLRKYVSDPQPRSLDTGLELVGRRKDGSEFPVDISLSPLQTDDGLLILSIIRDISAHKRADDALREREQQLRLITDNLPDPLAHVDSLQRYRFINPAYTQWFGQSEQEIVGKEVRAVVGEAAYEVIAERIEAVLSGERVDFEAWLPLPHGPQRCVRVRYVPHFGEGGRVQGFLVLAADITERKRAEDDLRRYQSRLAAAQQIANMGFWEWEIKTCAAVWSDETYRLYGLKPGEGAASYEAFLQYVHPDDRRTVEQAVETALRKNTSYDVDHRIVRADGTVRVLRSQGSVSCDSDGHPTHMVGTVIDITERKQAEDALRESEERYRLLIEGVRLIAWEFDRSHKKFTFVSRQAEAILGYPIDAWFEPTFWFDHLHPEDREWANAYSHQYIRRGEDHEFEYRMVGPDGRIVWFKDMTTVILRDSKSVILRGVLIDITERRQAEERARRLESQLAHVARVSTLGEMAAGLAHELNQPLTAIANYVNGCLRRLQTGRTSAQEVVPALQAAALQSERAGQIIQRLRSLIRKGEARRSTVHLNDVVRELAGLIEVEAREHDAVVRFELADDLLTVEIDKIQIQQVLLNLGRNACEAMSDLPPGKRPIRIRTAAAGTDQVQVSIGDAGRGIVPTDAELIFEPFFSTKPAGLGLGLAISRSIIEAHRGRLWATPNPQRGTTFHFTLPAARRDPRHEV